MGEQKSTMTKSERAELGQLIRKREKVMKAAAEERAAEMLADFEAQCAAIYSFNDDEVWAKAMAEAQAAVQEAQEKIAARCEEMGIPKEFAPGLSMGWHGRGQNAVIQRQAELRRVAKTRIAAVEKEAITRIERESLEAQTQVLSLGLLSGAARQFLEQMPSLESLMPAVDATEIKGIVDARQKPDRGW